MEKKIIITEIPNSFVIPEYKEEDFIFGSGELLGEVIQQYGQWLTPEEEIQVKRVESFNCTAFATTSIIEILFREVFGETKNFSDRSLGVFAGTRPPGNSPNVVIEAGRKKGLVQEILLPFSDNIDTAEKYYSYFGGDELTCVEAGKQFLKQYILGYDWVANGRVNATPEAIMEALKYSPLGVAVFAWAEETPGIPDDQSKYIRNGNTKDTHYTVIVGYKKGEYWIVFDSYAPHIKHLDWNFGFSYVMRYSLSINRIHEQISIIQRILNLMYQWLGLLEQQKKEKEVIKSIVDEVPPPVKTETLRGMSERVAREEGLKSYDAKVVCAVIQAESGFNQFAKNENIRNGKVVSTDWGICQINDYYWIGTGKKFPSVDYVLNNPEACVRWMCQQWRQDNKDWWIAYRNGSYKKYL